MVRDQGAMTTIGGLARRCGVGVETVRYYQRRGLLAVPGATAGPRRYGPKDERRLRFIRSGQAAGFTLDEIGALMALDADEDRPRARAMARERLAALDARIAQLTATRAALARLADACSASEDGPCPILTAFDSAG
ncbi:MAG: MerR family DNA-binding protein [Sphingomonas fennica]